MRNFATDTLDMLASIQLLDWPYVSHDLSLA
jgi:hypothetical protein